MAEQLDVYRDWLGIKETARPLNHYQLLRLKPFEDGTAKIREHYRKMNAHIRKFSTGDYADESQALLNELAKAMLALTDTQRKREYDASLGREDTGEGRRRTLEEILLAGKTITQEQLAKARSYADAVGLEVHDALVQQKVATADVVMLAYAESIGLPYIELADVGIDEQLTAQIPAALARQHSCVPVMIDRDQLLMASPNPLVPDVEEELRLRFEMPVRTILCTAASINSFVAEHYPRDAAEVAPVAQPKQKQKQPAAKPAEKPEREPLSQEEKLKRRNMAAILGFNLSVILYVFAAMLLKGMNYIGLPDVAIAVVLGTIVSAAAFVIASRLE